MNHSQRHRDGRRNPRGGAMLRAHLAGATALLACSAAHGGIVDINGGSSWSGWTAMGPSGTSSGWVQGSTSRAYNSYITQFTLEASQTVGGAPSGDTAASLFADSWKVGDRIIGVGLRYSDSSRLSNIWVHVDWAGDSIQAASSLGAGNGVYSANAGDLSLYATRSASGGTLRVHQYSVFTGYTADGGSNYAVPYGMGASTQTPTRAFSIFDGNGALSAQYFINLDAIARSNGGATFGEGVFGPNTKIGFLEADANWALSQYLCFPTSRASH